MDSFDKVTWFGYINKLNDRELSKRNSFGITLWALTGIVGLIIIKIIGILPLIKPTHGSLFALIALFFTSILGFLTFASLFILAYILRYLKVDGIKSNFLSPTGSLISMPKNFIFSLIMILGSVGYAIIIANDKSLDLEIWPFWILGIYFWFNLITDIMSFIYETFFQHKRESVINHAAKSLESFNIRILSNIWTLGLFLFLIVWFLAVKSIKFQVYILPNIEIIKLCFYLVGIILCLFIFNAIYTSYIKGKWLEEFERRIISEDLNAVEIRDTFNAEFTKL